jgi:hypothetical protein
VQSVRASSPAVKSDVSGPTMPGSLTYPVQGYPTPNMSGAAPNPTLKVRYFVSLCMPVCMFSLLLYLLLSTGYQVLTFKEISLDRT